jgi:hypothetical protein
MPRFMLFMYPGPMDEGGGPTPDAVEAMARYNEELTKAGALLAADGLHPPDTSASVTWSTGKPKITDGPFTEAKELVGGYWIIQAKSRDEAIEWASRVPGVQGSQRVEVRQIAELDEFSEEIQQKATLSQEPPQQTKADI